MALRRTLCAPDPRGLAKWRMAVAGSVPSAGLLLGTSAYLIVAPNPESSSSSGCIAIMAVWPGLILAGGFSTHLPECTLESLATSTRGADARFAMATIVERSWDRSFDSRSFFRDV